MTNATFRTNTLYTSNSIHLFWNVENPVLGPQTFGFRLKVLTKYYIKAYLYFLKPTIDVYCTSLLQNALGLGHCAPSLSTASAGMSVEDK